MCYYEHGGTTYVLALMKQGDVKVTVDIPGFLKDNILDQEQGKGVDFVLKECQGGEVQVDGSKNTHELTIEDVANGPTVDVTSSTNAINEADAGTAAAEVTYLFELKDENNALYEADQDVHITFKLVCKGVCEGVPRGEITVTIPAGQDHYEWVMDTLVNDELDERVPKDSFTLEIVKITGNEAQPGNIDATVDITDDDHAPDAQDDSLLFLVPPHASQNQVFSFNVLQNDDDADGDLLSIKLPEGQSFPYRIEGTYGWFEVKANGDVTYTVDATKDAVKNLTNGQTITEDYVKVTVTDGTNPVDSAIKVSIKAGTSSDGTADAESLFGSAGNDNIDGKGNADIIRAGDGNDTIQVYADGKGQHYGEGGQDSFVLKSGGSDTLSLGGYVADGGLIDGGTEDDRIVLNGGGLTLDATGGGWVNGLESAIKGVETLDVTSKGGTNNTILLDNAGVKALTDHMDDPSGILRVDGGTGDLVRFTEDTWTEVTSPAPSDALPGYILFENSSGTKIHVKEDMSVEVKNSNNVDLDGNSANYVVNGQENAANNIVGGSGDDVIRGGNLGDTLKGGSGADTIYGGAGNDTISLDPDDTVYGGDGDDTFLLGAGSGNSYGINDLGTVHGGNSNDASGAAGNDLLILQGTGNTLDLTGLAHGRLTSVETIQVGSSGTGSGNAIVITTGALAGISERSHSVNGGALTIEGGSSDTYSLTGSGWKFVQTTGGYHIYSNADGSQTLRVNAAMKMGSSDGADELHAYAGSVLDAKGGNDIIHVHDLGFTSIAGGTGTDTLQLDVTGGSLNLTGTATGISGIEIIDLGSAASGANAVTVDKSFLDANAATGSTLFIKGDAGDSYTLSGEGWLRTGGDSTYITYTNGGQTVKISTGMTRNMDGGSGADTLYAFTATDTVNAGANDDFIFAYNGTVNGDAGNDTIHVYGASAIDGGAGDDLIVMHGMGGVTVSGGTGEDTLQLDVAGGSLDLTGVATGISGIEVIDLGSAASGNNSLSIDSDFLAANAAMGNTLTVEGGTTDTFTLSGDGWVYSGPSGGYDVYTNNGETLKVATGMARETGASSGADTLYAFDAGDIVNADDGDDLINVYAGTANGGAGNDTFHLHSGSFEAINGDGGFDTLLLDLQGGGTLDLSDSGSLAAAVSGIERLEVASGTTLTLDAEGIRAMVGNTGTLELSCSQSDLSMLDSASWTAGGTATGSDSAAYNVYTYTDSAETVTLLLSCTL